MKTFTVEQIQKILQKHEIWIKNKTAKEAERADLQDANLRGAYLQDANLRDANLQDAYLRGADLQDADLRGANLRDAYLRGANLRGANLQDANLRDANLRGANLQDADLRGADCMQLQCPEEGSFIAFKKCREFKIVKLLIPEDAKRSSATSRKCRASKAVVLEITNLNRKIKYDDAISQHDLSFIYKVGETVEVDNFDDDRWNECAPGIHFFITRQEAIDY